MQEIGFDVISDLNLSLNDSFNWENKATSLYCIVAGNVSSNYRTIRQTLLHLSKFYQGVFYIPGKLEYQEGNSIPDRMIELIKMTSVIPNVWMLHQYVAVIDGIAIVGANGWASSGDNPMLEDLMETLAREEDISYLRSSLSRLQRHLDIKKIIVVSNAVPHSDLYFKENPGFTEDQTPLCDVLSSDTENKVTHWVFGTYDKPVDTHVDNINYVNNSKVNQSPYWAKRLTLLI